MYTQFFLKEKQTHDVFSISRKRMNHRENTNNFKCK